MTLFAFGPEPGSELDIFAVGDAMDARGWCLDRQTAPEALRRRHAKQRRALGHEVVAYTTLARKALAAEHKVHMAQSRREGAFRGDQEYVMRHWSEAQIDRYYDRAYDAACATCDREWDRADGLMSYKIMGTGTSQYEVELPELWFWTIAQSYGFDQLPWHLGGNADYAI